MTAVASRFTVAVLFIQVGGHGLVVAPDAGLVLLLDRDFRALS